MTITVYSNFKKRPNSTKQPVSGTDITATLKDKTSIETPTFLLAGSLSSYENVSYIKWGSRYYFVTDVSSVHNGVTEISGAIDRLATFKTEIGGSSVFIERCASGHSYDLRDDMICTSSENFADTRVGTGNVFPSALSSGVIAVTIANDDPSQYTGGTSGIYYFDSTGGTYTIGKLIEALYDSTVSGAINSIMNKPFDAILSVRYIPGFTCADLLQMPESGQHTVLKFGKGGSFNANSVGPRNGFTSWIYTKTWEFDLSSNAHFSIYKWMNLPPYSKWEVFLPFYGSIIIPAEEYVTSSSAGLVNMVIKATVDLTTGEMVYTRYRRKYSGGTHTDQIAQEYRTSIGVDVAIQGANRDTLAFTSDILSGVSSAALMMASGGSAAGALVAGAGAAARAAVDVAQQNYNTVGSFSAHGTQIALAEPNNIYLSQIGFEPQTTPTSYEAVIGAPLMLTDTVSSHPGFIKCMNASISIAGTQADKDAVNSMMNAGFYYE